MVGKAATIVDNVMTHITREVEPNAFNLWIGRELKPGWGWAMLAGAVPLGLAQGALSTRYYTPNQNPEVEPAPYLTQSGAPTLGADGSLTLALSKIGRRW